MPKSINNLIEGYRKFKANYFTHHKNLFDHLSAEGQKPQILIIACSDSRVDPAIITNAEPGDLFVIRNVANLVPLCETDEQHTNYHGTSAAIEFAVRVLKVKHIIICGHAQCGGLISLFTSNLHAQSRPSFISKWMSIAQKPFEQARKNYSYEDITAQVELCAKASLINSIKNLKTFPWLLERVEKQELFLHAWYFEIINCNIQFLDKDDQFKNLI